MNNHDMLILTGDDVHHILENQEQTIVDLVAQAYITHAQGDSTLPQSSFLRFPDNQRDRIIALPAYLGGNTDCAGVKWIASFPGNIDRGLDRASATILLNSVETGYPLAIMEGSIISAKRTAASAALAARTLHIHEPVTSVGIIGCGLINFEIVQFLHALFPDLTTLVLFDAQPDRTKHFGERIQKRFDRCEIIGVHSIREVLQHTRLVSFATTATVPHIADRSLIQSGSTILHVSLRDFAPQIILDADNVVDDIDHVCRERTSVHVAAEQTGNRAHMRCTLADILQEKETARTSATKPIIFSPFGLGILDIALSHYTYDIALRKNHGIQVPSFAATSWQRM
ncbi:MAG: 2,3-diaminopropionate biosynthesis protein SbnB [Chloroflexota bacterium]